MTTDLEKLAVKAVEAQKRLVALYAGSWRDMEMEKRDAAVQAFELAATPQAILTLTARNRELEGALRQIDAHNDSPARYNSQINAVIVAALTPATPDGEKK